jgi:hypothetical protein
LDDEFEEGSRKEKMFKEDFEESQDLVQNEYDRVHRQIYEAAIEAYLEHENAHFGGNWSIEDIRGRLEDRTDPLETWTEEDLYKIKDQIVKSMDASVGINWDVIDSHIDMYFMFKKEEDLAKEFSDILKSWLKPDNRADKKDVFKAMVERHIGGKYAQKDVCVSHEYCDSNVAMIDAIHNLTGTEPDISDGETQDWVNTAWALAKRKNFYSGL